MKKGNELKPRIGLFGRRNVGKSTMVNFLTGQQTAIVSDTAGTTTDPVRKSMEIGGIGPVVLIDTAGIDDEGELGLQRVEKSMAALAEVDLALLCFTEWGEPEERLSEWCDRNGKAMLRIRTQSDVSNMSEKSDFDFNANDLSLRDTLLEIIKISLPESSYRHSSLLRGVVQAGDHVVLVTPIDSSAPEGRMILPQVQVLRDLIDLHAVATFCQPDELAAAITPNFPKLTQIADYFPGGGLLSSLLMPKLVITDSQVFHEVAAVVPEETPLTSFSIVLARQKGLFKEYLEGTRKIGDLQDGDRVLLLESCTHNVTCEDIGRVKLPTALRRATGKQLEFDILAGGDPIQNSRSKIQNYKLVIQCGGCVITAQQVKARLLPALEAGVPVSNYGLALAWCNGIFDRATEIFNK